MKQVDIFSLSPIHVRLLRFLSDYRHPKSGLCTPTAYEIATALGVSSGYVRRLVRDLDQNGLVSRQECWEYDDHDTQEVSVPTPDRKWFAASANISEFRGPNLYTLTGKAQGLLCKPAGLWERLVTLAQSIFFAADLQVLTAA